MPDVKHLYALTHVSTYCTCGILTVTLPVGVRVHVLGSYMGARASGGGYVSMYGL
jgi:hypothetical protein